MNGVDYTVPATFHWQNSANAGYDAYGRVVWTRDPTNDNNHKTTTQYTPAADAPVTQSSVTNPLAHTTTTLVDPGRGLTTQIENPNGKKTRARYDPLGRLTDVWLDDRATTTTANLHYAYSLYTGPSTMNVIATTVLGPNGSGITSYDLYDGNLRQRQHQAPAPQAKGGRIVTDTRYDGRGLTAQTTTFWNVDSPPAAGLVNFADTAVKNQHRYTYDTLGRQTADALYSANALKWQTATDYDGNFTTVTPPDGGTATTTYVNGRGKTTELRQYLGDVPTGSYQTTTYTYDRLDRLRQVQDQSGNTWTTDYNLLGQVESTTDPDKGTTTTTSYDLAGRPTTVTDARPGSSMTMKYDELGRKIGLYDGTTTSGFQRAKWTYDTANNGTGQLASSTRYVTGNSGIDAYTTTINGYDNGHRPLGTTTAIPSSLNLPGLPTGNYTTSTTYKVDGSVATVTYPAAGGLPAETVTTTYDNTGRPLTLGSDPNAMYVAGTSYYGWGAPYQQMYGNGTKRVLQTTSVDEATGRLTSNKVETENQSTPNDWVQRLTQNYGYNNAGNVKYIREIDDAGATVSSECFNYDGLSRLTYAWTTANSTCGSGPSTGVVGGPDPYWLHYVYDATGNRTLEERYTLAGTKTTREYLYPTTGQRHTLRSVTATGDTTGTDNYTYDAAGNMLTRSIAGQPDQTLAWDMSRLATVTDSAGVTSYIYDADGNRLVSKDPTGVTVYLPGFELRKVGTTTTCTRYIGQSTRTTTGITWVITDHHGTGQLAIDGTTLTATRRKTDPFGNPRGTDPTWPNPHGFVGGIRDNTGLTHLGAREYEPATGRFISDDRVVDYTNPQQINGYAYASNNPTTSSDPTGLWTDHALLDGGAYEPPCSLYQTRNCGYRDPYGGGSPACVAPRTCQNYKDPRYVEPGVPNPGSLPDPIGPVELPWGNGPPDPGTRPWTTGPLKLPNGSNTGLIVVPLPDGSGSAFVPLSQLAVKYESGGCTVIAGTGMYDCHPKPGLGTYGICLSPGLAAYYGGNGSVCFGFDGRGWGLWASGGTNSGPQFGGGVGLELLASDGSIRDQKGGFETVNFGAGPVGGSYAWGRTEDGRDIGTIQAGLGLKGKFGGAAGGESGTVILWYSGD
ncbi:RHS repeat-associated core domain-containing protein [Dactylosporangium sp. NPDC005572]|uniref:RHS repeat domain-containing protein n=1 Tax=Dactylosporangium sp. NPDC005572 TaxID=3156889 RepID=UPI0033B999D2